MREADIVHLEWQEGAENKAGTVHRQAWGWYPGKTGPSFDPGALAGKGYPPACRTGEEGCRLKIERI